MRVGRPSRTGFDGLHLRTVRGIPRYQIWLSSLTQWRREPAFTRLLPPGTSEESAVAQLRDAQDKFARGALQLSIRRRTARKTPLELQQELALKKEMLHSAKSRARKAGVPFSLTLADIKIPTLCPLLGVELKRGSKENKRCSPSLDRIQPELGYVPGNVWVISHRANTIKNNSSLKEFLDMASNLRRKVLAK